MHVPRKKGDRILKTQKEAGIKPPDIACKIKVSKNGPYLVSGKIPLTQQIISVDAEGTPNLWRAERTYPSGEKCALCRCGQSKNKPLCDGTHVKVNFDGTETASNKPYAEQAKVIEGPSLRLRDDEELCASARFCHRAGGIWNLVPNSNDKEAKKAAIEEACDCPSGRLVIQDKDTKKVCEPPFEQSIGVIEDPQKGVSGPVWVRGGIPVEAANGKTYEIRNRVTLCRCGKSSNKPFCDSSHYPEEHEHEGDV
jgi:CDGSH-type Zn-finger protein